MGKQNPKIDPNKLKDLLAQYKKKQEQRDVPETKTPNDVSGDRYFETGELGFGKTEPSQTDTPWPTTTIIDQPEVDIASEAEQEADTTDDLLDALSPNPIQDIQDQVDTQLNADESLRDELQVQPPQDQQKQASIDLGVEQERLKIDIQGQLDRGDVTSEEAQYLMDSGIAKFQAKQAIVEAPKDNGLPEAGVVPQDAVKDIFGKKDIGTPSEELDKIIANELRAIDDKKYEDYTFFGLGLRQGIEMIKSVDDQLSIVKDNTTIGDNTNKIKGINKLISKYGEDHILSTEKYKKGIGDYSEPRTLGQMVKLLEDENLAANKNAVEKYKSASKKLAKYQRSDIPSSIGGINNIGDFGAFASSTLGQSVPQLAVAIGTLGTGTFMMETGMIQMQMIDELIAENPKLTPKIIFEKSLTDSDWAIGGGIVAGSLDVISLGLIAKSTGLTKLGSKLIAEGATELAKKQTKKQVMEQIGKGIAHSALSESITEPLQGVVEGFSAAKGTGRDYEFSQDQFLTEMLAGAIMGAGMGGSGSVVSSSVKNMKLSKTKKSTIKEQTRQKKENKETPTNETKKEQETPTAKEEEETILKKEDKKEEVVEGIKETPPSKEDVSFVDKAIEKSNESKEPNVLEKGILNFIKGGVFTDNFKEHLDRRESNKGLREKNPEFATRMDEGKLRWNNLGKVTRPLSMASEMGLKASEELVNKAKELEKFRVDKYRVEGENSLTNDEKIEFSNKVTELAKDYAKENELIESKQVSKVEEAPTESTKQKTESELAEETTDKSVVAELINTIDPKKTKEIESEMVDKAKKEDAIKGISKKKQLEKKIEKTGTSKKSDYIKRKLKDVRDTPVFKKEVESIGDYTPHDKELANIEATNLINDFQKEYGDKEGLREAFKLLRNKEIPELMIGPLSAKIDVNMQAEGMIDEAINVVDYKQKTLRESARTLTGAASEASPEETVSRLFAGLADKKAEALGSELKEGTTYNEAFEEIKKRLSDVEQAYEELKEELEDERNGGKSRSAVLKKRGRALKKEGFAQLDKYFKSQRGSLSMGLRVDADLISALSKVFRGYLLEFEGNTLLAFEKFKNDTSDNYDLSKEDIDSAKTTIFEQSKETIEEFKQEKQLKIVENILKPKGKETNADRKTRKETSKAIVEAYNEEKSDSEILDLFSGMAKFKKLTEKDTREILDLMEKQSQLLSEGKKRLAHKAWVDLMFKLGDTGLLKRAKTDVLQDIWYTWVLSGLTTIARSLKGSGVSDLMFVSTRLLANPKVAPFALAQMIRGAKGNTKAYLNVLATGETEFNMTDFDPKLPQFTSEITNRSFKDLSIPKRIAKVLASPIIYAFRNIPAFDQVIGNIASEGNIAVAEFSKTDRSKKTSERLKELKLALAENRNEEIRELVSEELDDMNSSGEYIPIGYKQSRFREIKNEFRDRDAVARALDDSRIGAFVSTPKGSLGYVYNAWVNAIEIKKDDPNAVKGGKLMMKGIFPFIRVSFNWLNAGLEYTPAGLVRAGFKQSRWTKDGIEKMTDYERRELVARAIIGMSVGTSILLSMFDWDDDEGFTIKDEKDMWIQVHGPLTGKWYETDGVNKGAKPWSFRFQYPDGEWSDYYLYRDNPIGHMLAPIGIMHDELRISKFKKDLSKKEGEITFDKMDAQFLLGAWVNGTFQYASDQSFNQGMKTLSGLFSKNKRKTAGEKLTELVTRPAEALINPALYKQTYNYFKAYQGIPEKQDRSWLEHAYKGIPIVDGLIKNDAYDVFGYPIVRSFDVPGIPDFILEMAKDNLSYREELKEWKLLWKYEQVVLAGFYIGDKISNGHVLTSEEKDQFMLDAGLKMREYINNNYHSLNNMEPKELQKELNSYKSKSKNDALKKIKQ